VTVIEEKGDGIEGLLRTPINEAEIDRRIPGAKTSLLRRSSLDVVGIVGDSLHELRIIKLGSPYGKKALG